jgi:hypothetical protein
VSLSKHVFKMADGLSHDINLSLQGLVRVQPVKFLSG